mgnify:CR=1 FL=1
MFDAVSQHIDHATLADLAAQASKKLQPHDILGVLVIPEAEFLELVRLCGTEKGKELYRIQRVSAVVGLGIASDPAVATGQRRRIGHVVDRRGRQAVGAGQVPHDQGFEALLTGVCFHCAPSPAALAIKYPSSTL